METIVLKIGGSVLTHKDENRFQVREAELARIAREIAEARSQTPFRLVLVHGAGPFGHTMVERYGIRHGVRGSRGTEGFVRTHNSMEDLDYRVMCALRDEGVPAFPVQPSAVIRQRDRRISHFDLTTIEGLLRLDPAIVPLLYGDMVLDDRLGASVVSGDAIVAHLARRLPADRVAIGTDVPGICAADPKSSPGAPPFARVDRGNFHAVMRAVSGARTVDVTGGMARKLEEIATHLEGIPVVIFDAFGPRNVARALRGEPVGTRIEL